MFGICNHKFGKVKDGYQYCEKCGKAIPVPCNHNWVVESKFNLHNIVSNYQTGTQYILRCTKCGEMMEEKFMSKDKE